jgi:hypothetical protein
MIRLVGSLVHAASVGAFFAGYYLTVRSAPPDTIVDFTSIILLLAPISLVSGAFIGRWWAIVLPLIAFPMAALMVVIGAVDDRYSRVAADRGGAVGVEWFAVAALVCAFAVPAAAFGAGLRAWGAARRRRAGFGERVR